MQLNLDKQELDTLREVLESAVSDLGMEIADTDSQDFREMLKLRKATLRRILDRLGAPVG